MSKINLSRLVVLLALLISLPALASASDLQLKETTTDGICPGGFALMTFSEAQSKQDTVCKIMQEWDIARLAPKASISGLGYKCALKASDDRTLGASICVQAVFKEGAGDGHCPDGYVVATEQTGASQQSRDHGRSCGGAESDTHEGAPPGSGPAQHISVDSKKTLSQDRDPLRCSPEHNNGDCPCP